MPSRALPPAPHPAPVRLPLDRRAVRAEAVTRLVAGVIALGAGLWLLAVSGHPVLRLMALAGLGFSALWARRYLRARATLDDPDQNYLELSAHGLTLVEAGRAREVPWRETTGVAVDEDSLQVIVMRASAPEFRVEPCYDGLPLRKLAEIIYQYRCSVSSCIGDEDG